MPPVKLLTDLGLEMLHTLLILVLIITHTGTQIIPLIYHNHEVGFVFGTMLWDLTWAFIDQPGYDPDLINGSGGNNKIMQLFIDALKVSPCNPGFVEFRDAILLADDLTNNGIHECLIWEVLQEGLGLADQGNANNRQDQTEDFQYPHLVKGRPNDMGILSIDSPETGVLTNDSQLVLKLEILALITLMILKHIIQ